MVALRAVVDGHAQAVDLLIAGKDGEAQAGVKHDRARIDRPGHGTHDGSSIGASQGEKTAVEIAGQAGAAPSRVDADEVEVGLLVVVRAEEADEKADELVFVLDDQRRAPEAVSYTHLTLPTIYSV